MSNVLTAAITMALVALATGPALAQAQALPQAQVTASGMTMGVPVTLLGMPAIQKELKLDESQIEKSRELIEATRQKSLGLAKQLADVPAAERRAKQMELLGAMNQESMKSVAAILKPDQHARLLQLEIQRRGFIAFLDPEILKTLGVSDEQKEKINTIRVEQETAYRALVSAALKNKEMVVRADDVRHATLVRMVDALTDDQKKKWKEMTGEAFEFNLARPPGR